LFQNLRRGDAGVEHCALTGPHFDGNLADGVAGENLLDDSAAAVGKRLEQPLDQIAKRRHIVRRRT
jgi:hypothetical protein